MLRAYNGGEDALRGRIFFNTAMHLLAEVSTTSLQPPINADINEQPPASSAGR